ncbi:MAG: deiodinase-like protein [Candidatus Spechtbacterales bacterium]
MSDYNYKNFKATYYNFTGFDGPAEGERAPDFKALTLDGKEVMLSDYFGKPLVLEMGSVTCPIYVGEIRPMQKLVEKFPEVEFLVLYVREAHPGEKIGPHESMEDKIGCANLLKQKRNETRTILVDDVEGTAHKIYGTFPDSVFIIDSEGKIAWRSQWNRTKEVEKNLERLSRGEKPVPAKKKLIDKPERLNISTFLDGGWIAVKDFILQFPALVKHRIFKK